MHELLSRQRNLCGHWQGLEIVSCRLNGIPWLSSSLIERHSRRSERPGENVQASYPPYDTDQSNRSKTAEDLVRSRNNGEPASPPASQDGTTQPDGHRDSCGGHSHDDGSEEQFRTLVPPVVTIGTPQAVTQHPFTMPNAPSTLKH